MRSPLSSSLASTGGRKKSTSKSARTKRIGDLEFLVQFKEAEVDLQEREQLGRDLAGDVEYRQRREEALRRLGSLELIDEVGEQLIETDSAVAVIVEQVEVDVDEDAAADAAAGDAEVQFGRGPQTAVEGEFGRVVPAALVSGSVGSSLTYRPLASSNGFLKSLAAKSLKPLVS